MTTDITELAQSLKRRATSANEFGESLYVKADEVLALVEALASEKRICATWRKTAEANSEKLEKAQAKADVYDMLRDDYGLREKGVGLADFVDWQAKRIAELESRTVTVKLPELCVGVVQDGHAVMVPYPAGHWFNKTAILEMLADAGIKVEAE
ncbi:TPA: hypothetical protein U1T24_001447 [Klebsiella quasipneumoniae]|nr:hypothetical protein [Klebsiella quasipneumoniae]